MREYTERRQRDWVSMIVTSFGSPGLSSVFVFGFSKSVWHMEEKFSFLQKYNEKKKKKECVAVWFECEVYTQF